VLNYSPDVDLGVLLADLNCEVDALFGRRP
jgi:hypothetical protein